MDFAARHQFHMQIDSSFYAESLQKFMKQRSVQRSDFFRRRDQIVNQIRPTGQVQRNHHQAFIHREQKTPVTPDPGLVPQGFGEGFAQHQPHIFHRVMGIHIQIPFRLDFQVKFAVPGEKFQHVVHEPDPGRYAAFPRPVGIQLDLDVGLLALQLDGQGAQLRVQNAALTAKQKYFSQNTAHNQPHTSADIFNYGIAMNGGYCDFDVRNRIDKGCRGCETHQTSRILTFDAQSKGRIMPVLYIDDNDVKASHAATMGQPDAEQVFYMQTRGLSRQDAMKLITIGYLMPISKVIDDADLNNLLKQEIETKVSQCLM